MKLKSKYYSLALAIKELYGEILYDSFYVL